MNRTYLDDNADKLAREISDTWDKDIIPQLVEYIKIPNKSVMFDPDWKKHGFMDQAMQLIVDWCQQQPIKDMKAELVQLPERTPLLFIEIPGQIDDTVLLYGHMDKQPEMTGWDDDLGPWKPVIKGDLLYGRGGADDGYSAFAALTAIATLQRHKIPHGRCIVVIEACEESGSADLPFYLEHLKDRVGAPNYVICLDSGAGNYEQMWCTTSLRGMVGGRLDINVTTEGIHSGVGSGVIPSTFIILRQLLNRIENCDTGEVFPNDFKTEIPKQYVHQAQDTAKQLGDGFLKAYPFLPSVKPVSNDIAELLLNRSWRAELSVTGIDGLPPTANAGNVTIPHLSVVLSMRLPPNIDTAQTAQRLKQILEQDPPFGAKVNFELETNGPGWQAPEVADWVANANNQASQRFFNRPASYIGEGGSIPFMGMLGEKYPAAQFSIIGVLGPRSNAHGPNEFLHIPMGKGITGCVASLLASHYEQFN